MWNCYFITHERYYIHVIMGVTMFCACGMDLCTLPIFMHDCALAFSRNMQLLSSLCLNHWMIMTCVNFIVANVKNTSILYTGSHLWLYFYLACSFCIVQSYGIHQCEIIFNFIVKRLIVPDIRRVDLAYKLLLTSQKNMYSGCCPLCRPCYKLRPFTAKLKHWEKVTRRMIWWRGWGKLGKHRKKKHWLKKR